MTNTITKTYAPLREARCYYANGDIIETSMSASLTDDEMTSYFLNNTFNIGKCGHDKMVKCIKVEILK